MLRLKCWLGVMERLVAEGKGKDLALLLATVVAKQRIRRMADSLEAFKQIEMGTGNSTLRVRHLDC